MQSKIRWRLILPAGLLILAAACSAVPRAQALLEQVGFLPLISHGGQSSTATPIDQITPVPGAVIVDHRAVAVFDDLPEAARRRASELPILMRHASVGEEISAGLDCLAGLTPGVAGCEGFQPGVYDRSRWDFQSRGNPGWQAKVDDLVTQTALQAPEFAAFTMKFCFIDAQGEDSPDWTYYREALLQLQRDYPEKTFIWWTIPLTSSGNAGADRFNALVRAYARANGKVLFDIADIEAHSPQGEHQTSAAGYEILYLAYTYDGGHLNLEGRLRVAKAWWVLAASLNGWE